MMPKRFDTLLFSHRAGRSHCITRWLRIRGLGLDRADGAVQEANSGKRTIIFPTLRNLEKLAEAKTVDEALRNTQQLNHCSRITMDGKTR